MAVLVIPNSALITLKWSFQGQEGRNVLGASAPAPIPVSQTLVNTVGAGIKAAFGSSGYAALCNGNTGLQKVGMRNIHEANQAEFEDAGAAVIGTGAGDALPQSNAVCVTLKTAMAGRSFQGRVYLGGWNELANTTTATIDTAAGTAAVAFIEAISDVLTANGMSLSVLSRPRDAVPGSTITVPAVPAKLGFPTPVNLVLMRDSRWDTIRGRLD